MKYFNILKNLQFTLYKPSSVPTIVTIPFFWHVRIAVSTVFNGGFIVISCQKSSGCILSGSAAPLLQ